MTAVDATGVTHHRVEVNGTGLHYVSAGSAGSPVLLVHGFPESWWTFHAVIPLLAAEHRVVAVDLRGFGDSDATDGDGDGALAAEDLHQLVTRIGVGPVHVVGQDISGTTVFRLAATHPEDVLSLTAIESGLAGFGLEMLADVTRGGAWYIGALTAPGIPELLLSGREREFLQYLFDAAGAVATAADIEEFTRTYSRAHGWNGAVGLYRSMLRDGDAVRALPRPLRVPVLAIGAAGGTFTADTFSQVAVDVRTVALDGVGHYAALDAPDRVAGALLDFLRSLPHDR